MKETSKNVANLGQQIQIFVRGKRDYFEGARFEFCNFSTSSTNNSTFLILPDLDLLQYIYILYFIKKFIFLQPPLHAGLLHPRLRGQDDDDDNDVKTFLPVSISATAN